MTRVSAGQNKLLGLGRYRFQECLSTCFFGPRYRITCDAEHVRSSQIPVGRYSISPGQSQHPAKSEYPSVRPSADLPLAMRLVCADTQPEIERLARAVQSVRDLDHRAVLRPLQMVRSSTRLGVITQHVEGVTLAQLLANGNMEGIAVPPPITLRIIVDVIEGLEALRAHATATRRQDWLFGGLTPDNILVGSDGQSRLIDPGLNGAAARQPAFAHEAAALAYTAPEQTSPDARYAAASDVFSLGVMLWELLTGQPLFAAATAAQTLENLHRAPIERVQRQQFVRGEPIAFSLAQAVANALKRNPTQRLQDYDALMTAIVQAGPIGRPEAVAELVQQGARKESIADIKERIARLKREAEAAGATAPRITLPVSAMVSARTQPGLAPPHTLPPTAPRDEAARPSSAPTVPPESTSNVGQFTSAPPTARIRKLPGPAQITTVRPPRISQGPTVPRLGDGLSDPMSAFPIGDLRRSRRSPARRSRVVPLAAAAVLMLGVGAWSLRLLLQRDKAAESPPAAASGRSPEAPHPVAATAARPPAQPAARSPTAAPPEQAAEAVGASQAKPPNARDAQADAAATAAKSAKIAAPTQPAVRHRARPRSEPKKPNPAPKPAAAAAAADHESTAKEATGGSEASPQSTPVSELPPPEPEPRDSVLKITPAPEPPLTVIPEDI